MRCCVPGCKNDSRHISKSQGITFHVFPNEPALRTSWLRALGKEEWEPKERSAVCSEHFLCEDLYETKSGLRKVKSGAVPIVLQDTSSCEYGDSADLKVCRICLTMEGRLLSIRKHKLQEAYYQLTGLTMRVEDQLPQRLCAECAHRLASCIRFRSKSLRAHALLWEIVSKQDALSLQSIATINRDNNSLSSSLKLKYYDPDYCDATFHHTEQKEPICEVNVTDEIDIKNETNDFNDFNEIKQENYFNDGNDADFVTSDKEYSTDDSLPLEARRTKKEKVKEKIEKKEVVKKARKRPVEKDPSQPKVDRRRKPFLNDELNETLFTITDLTHAEQLAEILKRQDSANYKNSVFRCEACFKGFLDEDAYNSHVIRHTDQCGEYECSICKTHFKHPHALRKHITAHHTQRFSCNQCPYVTTHRQTARLHERWHKGTKYQCPHCPDEFVKFTTYMGHIRIKHPSDFVCQLCGYSFVSEKGIELHKKLKHRLSDPQIPDDGPFCELCNVRFVSSEALRRHIHVSARHTGSDKGEKESNKPKRPRRSREPGARERGRDSRDSSAERGRRYPSQLRKAEGPIPCEQCGMQLEDSRAYHGHFRRMHPDKNRTNYPSMKSPCMCEVCGRMFQSYALLKDHTWTHTGERPFSCDACGKAFRMKQRLVAHRRVHSAQRASYACGVCGKPFSTHSNRQRHMFIHTGLKPFKCEMCGKSFKHASEKRAHITYVHLKKPWPKRARGKRRQDRQSTQHPQMAVATGASEMDIVQPLWPSCDPKLADINALMDDKPMYYNLKI